MQAVFDIVDISHVHGCPVGHTTFGTHFYVSSKGSPWAREPCLFPSCFAFFDDIYLNIRIHLYCRVS